MGTRVLHLRARGTFAKSSDMRPKQNKNKKVTNAETFKYRKLYTSTSSPLITLNFKNMSESILNFAIEINAGILSLYGRSFLITEAPSHNATTYKHLQNISQESLTEPFPRKG